MTIDANPDRPLPPPMCDQAEFDELMAEMVADEAPRLFAVVHELGNRADGWVAAWGLAFEDHVEVVNNGTLMSLTTPDRARHLLSHRPNRTAHIVWVDQFGEEPIAPVTE